MDSIEILKELKLSHLKSKYPSVPDGYIPVPKYTDKTANGLTKCVIDFLQLKGHQAERISSTGRYIDDTKIVKDALGRERKIGSGKYIPGNGTKGTADISSTIKVDINGRTFGLSAKWEVKMKDKQSDYQKKYEEDIQSAGGYYFIIHNFDEFMKYYICIIENKY